MGELAFEGISKSYGSTEALRGLDLTVVDGELLVVVGPSGCGKTTALRIAAGLERPNRGIVRISGRDVTDVDPGRRNVSMIFQSYALYPHLSVAENIGFGLAARGVDRAAAAPRVREAAELVGCGDLLDRRPSQLSGGQRQRVALARALVREPDVFLLDEPLSNLDAQLRVQVRAELRALQRRLGATMVHVTHDQVEALTMGDRIVVLRDGSIQQLGTADDVYRRPANRFVAAFIGSPAMNFLPAELEGGELRAGPFRLPIPAPLLGAGSAGRSLEIGIRPEHLALVGADDAEAGDRSAVPATVLAVEPAGSETYVHLEAAGTRLVMRAGPDARPAAGSIVGVAVSPGAIHLFDRESGLAVR